ncbi:class I SAM-dependent methyltransferase [Litorivicinus sp.]|nr:class I SAM-dependent methyltransferase [Litorivicinus sp.]MDC1208332.1 class I SAM-dependent methyltransferase [Litorivicinus sp.]MDC1240116.1 class I SAM-dependent methyltransferase [Litorivicinus sp.]
MKKKNDLVLNDVADYYSKKIKKHGACSQGVDWSSADSQNRRFYELLKVINDSAEFSINDLGCGYGGLLKILNEEYDKFIYYGFDISPEMIKTAKDEYAMLENVKFFNTSKPQKVADFSIASGLFNVRFDYTNDEWKEYIFETLDVLDSVSRLGFSFNCLTKYSDEHLMKKNLYYADPLEFFDLCKTRFSRNIALLHDYALYEFTIIVRKNK